MCQMKDSEQCQELRLGWVLDNNNNQLMAVRTDEGWREIMVMTHFLLSFNCCLGC